MQVKVLVSTTKDHREVLGEDQIELSIAHLSYRLNCETFDTSEINLLVLSNIFFEKLQA